MTVWDFHCDLLVLAAAFLGGASPGVIDKDLTHYARGNGQEMDPIVELKFSDIEQFDVRFMHQSRCL